MKNAGFCFFVLCLSLFLGGLSVVAQEAHQHNLPIEIMASPREQIELGKDYMNQALNAQDSDEQFRLAGLAVGHLIAVGKIWPEDRIGNLNANLLIADLGMSLRFFQNAEDHLLLAEDFAGQEELPLVRRRQLLTAKARGDREKALEYSQWLSAPGRLRHLAITDRVKAYNDVIGYYESIEEYQDAARAGVLMGTMPEMRGRSRAAVLLRSAKNSHRAGRTADARATARLVQSAVDEARAEGGPDLRVIKGLQKELDELVLRLNE